MAAYSSTAKTAGETGDDNKAKLALSFGAQAADYAKGRPEYPAAAAKWIVDQFEERNPNRADPGILADIGAGTGKLMAAFSNDYPKFKLVAVEPDAVMLEQLGKRIPRATRVIGTAEKTGLEDRSVSLAVFGQAWHWVDPPAATRELDRILEQPNGIAALVWNVRDEREDCMRRLTEIIGPSEAELYHSQEPSVGEQLVRASYQTFDWKADMSRDQALAMVNSRSPIIALSADRRAEVLRRVERLLDEHPHFGAKPVVQIPYQTRVTILERRGG